MNEKYPRGKYEIVRGALKAGEDSWNIRTLAGLGPDWRIVEIFKDGENVLVCREELPENERIKQAEQEGAEALRKSWEAHAERNAALEDLEDTRAVLKEKTTLAVQLAERLAEVNAREEEQAKVIRRLEDDMSKVRRAIGDMAWTKALENEGNER